eukprot:m.34388 g.34388  ORF g.34388 m.34388 type:complete len:127 (-) comp12297_c0_seq1:1952-2332(-)
MSTPKQPKKRQVPHREAYERMNFLFQLGLQCLQLPEPNLDLCRHYVLTLRAIARRLVLRIDPLLKRQICKNCSVILQPGSTSRIKLKHGKQTVSCLCCAHKHTVHLQGRAPATARAATSTRSGLVT